jgi:uncharacterized protein
MEVIAMSDIVIKGHKGARGIAEGKAMVCRQAIDWVTSFDMDGTIVDKKNDLYGKNVKGSILVFPDFNGTTSAAMRFYELAYRGSMPKGIVITKADSVTLSTAVLAGIPLVHNFKDRNPVDIIKDGDTVIVNGDEGTATIKK